MTTWIEATSTTKSVCSSSANFDFGQFRLQPIRFRPSWPKSPKSNWPKSSILQPCTLQIGDCWDPLQQLPVGSSRILERSLHNSRCSRSQTLSPLVRKEKIKISAAHDCVRVALSICSCARTPPSGSLAERAGSCCDELISSSAPTKPTSLPPKGEAGIKKKTCSLARFLCVTPSSLNLLMMGNRGTVGPKGGGTATFRYSNKPWIMAPLEIKVKCPDVVHL